MPISGTQNPFILMETKILGGYYLRLTMPPNPYTVFWRISRNSLSISEIAQIRPKDHTVLVYRASVDGPLPVLASHHLGE